MKGKMIIIVKDDNYSERLDKCRRGLGGVDIGSLYPPHIPDIVSLSKGRCDQDQSKEHGKSPTSVDQSIGHEGVELADTKQPQPL